MWEVPCVGGRGRHAPRFRGGPRRTRGRVVPSRQRAYKCADVGMWRGTCARTSVNELAAAVRARLVAAARVDGRGRLYLHSSARWHDGVVMHARGRSQPRRSRAWTRARRLRGTTSDVGWLDAVAAGAAHADRGGHRALRLLAQGYQRLGYPEGDRASPADVEPEAVPFLAVPCQIVIRV